MDSQIESHPEARPTDVYTQAQSPLFWLPFEVRQQIYRLLLAFTWDKFIMTNIRAWSFSPFIDGDTHCQPLPAPMLACKRLYHDLAPQALGEAAISFFMLRPVYSRNDIPSFLVGKAAHGRLRLSRLRKLVIITNSRHNVELGNLGWGPNLTDILKTAICLREVVLEMYSVPVPVSDLQNWLDVQTETLLPSLRQVHNLDLVHLRTNVPISYRGLFPNILAEAIKEETGATVFQTELRDRWAACQNGPHDHFQFFLRPRGQDQPSYFLQQHPDTRILVVTRAPTSKNGKAILGYERFNLMCPECFEIRNQRPSNQDCCQAAWSIVGNNE